jgi:two-component system sensor histidine kinase KdpD
MVDTRDQRPDPDALLSLVQEQEKARYAGRLKIFFGACAGVGKTYAMLRAGHERRAEGTDVVIGVVETHDRAETVEAVADLPSIPPRQVDHKGVTLKEFDLDAAIAQRPQLILLDELAHTNAPGSRHPKRWQDVEELLEEGIDVYTTLNVQHIESLNDVVARITGIWVKETVPDALFDRADDIALIDIPPDELLKRLREGKVYLGEQVQQRAANNFFRKGNLIALREMALRLTAERVDAQMARYTNETGTKDVSATNERILVCIGPDALSLKLVRAAKRIAGRLKVDWVAVYVESDRHYQLSQKGLTSVDRTLRLADEMGGETRILNGSSVPETLVNFARNNNISRIIVGQATRRRWYDIFGSTSLAQELIRTAGGIDIYVIAPDGISTADPELLRTEKLRLQLTPFLHNIGGVVVATLFSLPFQGSLDSGIILMVYVLASVLTAVRAPLPILVLTTFVAMLVHNLLFVTPYYLLSEDDGPFILSWLALLATTFFISRQSSRLKLQADYSRARERNMASLYAMTRALSSNRGIDVLAAIATKHIGESMEAEVYIWLPTPEGSLRPSNDTPIADEGKELSVARWAFQHRQNAGLGTTTLPTARGLYIPMSTSSGVLGVAGIIPRDGVIFSSEKVGIIETFVSQAASALERAMIADIAEKTRIGAETEKLRNLLLSSVSHDLRAPVAAIAGASSTLMIDSGKLNEQGRDDLLRVIHSESSRLSKIVTNLLDVTSLETGAIKLSREYFFVEELIGSALLRVKETYGNWAINVQIAEFIPLVFVDGLLIEQVFVSLLEHVANHGERGETVRIKADVVADMLEISISYRPDADRMSDDAVDKSRGGGLGLGICRGIITAHRGQMQVSREERDNTVKVTLILPMRDPDEESATR